MRLSRFIGTLLLLLAPLAAAPRAAAQPATFGGSTFGSADDPSEEIQRVWWRRDQTLDLAGGLSLIGAQWRAASTASLDLATRPFTARLQATARAGVYGTYGPDFDEPYDALRLIRFVRLEGDPARRYLRVGPLERMRLGTGHTVNFLASSTAWDERTVGAEAWASRAAVDVGLFTDNLLFDGVVGGRVALRPLFWADDARSRSFTLGFNAATDLATQRRDSIPEITAYNADLAFDAVRAGAIALRPFASVAWYRDHGSGILFGADLHADNFIDLARFRFRLALFYNGAEFIPGYLGSFYTVSNPRARILNSERYLGGDAATGYEGVLLNDARGGNGLLTELRLLIFERFELWYFFRRHYGSQSLSEYHLRLFVRLPERVTLNLGVDRGGLRGLFSLLNEFGDQTALVFETDYRLAGSVWIFLRSRYSYDKVGPDESGTERYLPQRRFEPMTGFRLTL